MIAILGATGYIGRSLARLFSRQGELLTLFARNVATLAEEAWAGPVKIARLADFDASEFSLVINGIGAGDSAKIGAMGASLMEVTQAWDRRVLTTLGPKTAYVFLSSGAIYGTFDQPGHAKTTIELPVNGLGEVPPYVLAKLIAEASHRHAPERSILDLRIFGYADASISLDGRFFLAELARSVVTGAPFVTNTGDMVRDYAGAEELAALIRHWQASGSPNMAVDLYSRAPISKNELLAEATRRYGITIELQDSVEKNPTGPKAVYASRYHAASRLGYVPRRTSLKIVTTTLDAILRARKPFVGV